MKIEIAQTVCSCSFIKVHQQINCAIENSSQKEPSPLRIFVKAKNSFCTNTNLAAVHVISLIFPTVGIMVTLQSINISQRLVSCSSVIASQQLLRSTMLNFQFKKNHYFERANILLFRTDP